MHITYHAGTRLSDDVFETVTQHTSLERILAWTTDIAAMIQQDEFSSDIVIRVDDVWLVYGVT